MYIIGIDFGHGETSAAIFNTDQTNKMVPTDIRLRGGNGYQIQNCVIPSILVKSNHDSWSLYSNDEQVSRSKAIASHFKGPIRSMNGYPGINNMQKKNFAIFAKLLIDRIKMEYPVLNTSPYKILIACPSGWSEEMMQDYKSFFMAEMDNNVGDVMPESVAALCYARYGDVINSPKLNKPKNYLIIDFGSSTIDLTFLKLSDGSFKNNTINLGGHKVEQTIYDYMLNHENSAKNALQQLSQLDIDPIVIKEKLLFNLRLQKESYYYQNCGDEDLLGIGFITFDKITGNRQLISQFFCPDKEDCQYHATDIDKILSTYKDTIKNKLQDYKKTVLNGEAVDELITTGGASRMNFIADICKEVFKPSHFDPTTEPELSVSRGLAMLGNIPVDAVLPPVVHNNPTEVKEPNNGEMPKESVKTENAKKSIKQIIAKVKQIPEESVNDGNSLAFLKVSEQDLRQIINEYSNSRGNILSEEQIKSLSSSSMINLSVHKFIECCEKGEGIDLGTSYSNNNDEGNKTNWGRAAIVVYQLIKMLTGMG